MSEVKIRIETDNAAFEGDSYGREVADILHVIAGEIEEEGRKYGRETSRRRRYSDANGNKVCVVEV